MALACREGEPWTLGGLAGAFLNLALAYFLLCASALVFFASKFLRIFWLNFPCPCNGLLGYRNHDLCLHKLLIDGPVTNINAVFKLVKSKFPFDVLWSEDQRCNLNRKLIRHVNWENGVHESEGVAYSSPFSSPRWQNMVDRESGYDAKGKRIMTLKKRTGVRRPRRAAPEYGKLHSLLLNDSSRAVARIFPFPCDDRDTREISGDSSILVAGSEYGTQDDVKAPNEDYTRKSSSQFCGSVDESKGEKDCIVGNETDTIRMLQEALEREKAACAALYLELEKERAAAATAADEAMAMISRLQKDKASIEMEVRQYQRMIEEKFVYDEEEMDVLKEILLRREKENHFLEKEVEAYRRMSFEGNEQPNGDLSDVLCESGQRHDPLLTLQQTNKVGNIGDSTFQCEVSFVEKQIQPNGHDSHEKCVHSASQANSGFEKNLYFDEEEQLQYGDLKSNLCSSVLDSEPAVYDVHVVDGKTELSKEESRSSVYTALDGSEDLAPTFRASGIRSTELSQDFPSSSRVDTELKIITSSLDMHCGLPMLDNSRCKTLVIDSTKNSLSTVNNERLKIDTEVELLMEKLQILEERKGKLTSSSEHGQWQTSSQLPEDIKNPLCKIQQLRNHQASLPPLSSKVNLNKTRCQSMPLEAHESASS